MYRSFGVDTLRSSSPLPFPLGIVGSRLFGESKRKASNFSTGLFLRFNAESILSAGRAQSCTQSIRVHLKRLFFLLILFCLVKYSSTFTFSSYASTLFLFSPHTADFYLPFLKQHLRLLLRGCFLFFFLPLVLTELNSTCQSDALPFHRRPFAIGGFPQNRAVSLKYGRGWVWRYTEERTRDPGIFWNRLNHWATCRM